MRNEFIKALIEVAKTDKKIFLLTGDLGYNIIEPFVKKYPNRFLNVGVAESNLVNVACGLSSMGYIPFIYSIASFMTLRPFENIRNNISLQNANVKIVGVGGGYAYTKAGATHHSVEDIAIMKSLSNMTIISPADLEETYLLTKQIAKLKGPVYLRLERDPEKEIFNHNKCKLGKAEIVKKGKNMAILTTGTKLSVVYDLIPKLQEKKIFPSIINFSTIKPVDEKMLFDILKNNEYIITVEEHNKDGGFGSIVADFILEKQLSNKLIKFGIENKYIEGSYSYKNLLNLNNLSSEFIYKKLIKLPSHD